MHSRRLRIYGAEAGGSESLGVGHSGRIASHVSIEYPNEAIPVALVSTLVWRSSAPENWQIQLLCVEGYCLPHRLD